MLCPNCFSEINNPGQHCMHCGYPLNEEREPHLLPCGALLHDTYIIGRVLGEGGFGITYLAYNKNIQMQVALKEFFPKGLTNRNTSYGNVITFSGNPQSFQIAKQQFINEARMLAKFQNLSGIASVYDCFEENGTAYIIMEYIKGRTLNDVLRTYPGKLSVDQCLSLMRPVMQSLEELHKNGIIHRDISPDNLILRPKAGLVLIDFGAARDFVINQGYDMSVILRRKYAPIEQYSSKNIQGPWTDVYALSATIYRCITEPHHQKPPTD